MDANLWKQIVDKAIYRTLTRDLLWSKSDLGPSGTLSFKTSIDDSTSLNIWGFATNYSYEMFLTKQTAGEPFEERKRATTKRSAEGIDFKGLFDAAKEQVNNTVREQAFNAVLDFLDNPTVLDPETEEVVFPENQVERSSQLNALSATWFTYSEDEAILTRIRDLTAAGSIPWTFSEPENGDKQFFSASVGDSDADGFGNLYMSFRVVESESKTVRRDAYIFEIQHEPNFLIDVDIKPTNKRAQKSWTLMSEIHSIVLKQVHKEAEEFKQIIRNNIMHEILASLDNQDN